MTPSIKQRLKMLLTKKDVHLIMYENPSKVLRDIQFKGIYNKNNPHINLENLRVKTPKSFLSVRIDTRSVLE